MAGLGDLTAGVRQMGIGKHLTWDKLFNSKNLLVLAQKLGNSWRPLATALQFEVPDIQNFEANTHTQQDAALNMMTRYRDGSPLFKTREHVEEFLDGLMLARRVDLVKLLTGEDVVDPEVGRPLVREVAPHQAGDKYPQQESAPGKAAKHDAKDPILFCDEQFYTSKREDPHVYNVCHDTSQPRGFAIIINITRKRDGAQKDVELMTSLFTQLHYDVHKIADETKEVIMAKLKDFSQDRKLRNHDSIVVFLMAHGQADHIFDVNDFPIYCHELFDVFRPQRCPGLEGKPKLFFFQSCRGVRQDYHVQTTEEIDATQVETVPITSHHADMMISHATVPGHAAYRDAKLGSRYPRAIWEVFTTQAKDTHVLDLLTRVNAFMHDPKNLGVYKLVNSKTMQVPVQCAEKTSTLRQDFYFFPRR